LYELLKREVLSSKIVQTDDSWIKIQDRLLKRKMRKGKITAYVATKVIHSTFLIFTESLFRAKQRDSQRLQGFCPGRRSQWF